MSVEGPKEAWPIVHRRLFWVFEVVAIFLTLLTSGGVLLAGMALWTLVLFLLGAAYTIGVPVVLREVWKWPLLAQARFGRVGLVLLTCAYVAVVGMLVWFDPIDLNAWIWVFISGWEVLTAAVFVLVVRVARNPSLRLATRAEVAVMCAVFMLGISVLGAAGGIVGLGVRELRNAEPVIGATLFLEAAVVIGAGLAISLSRLFVAALGVLVLGIIVAGFGAASIYGGDTCFGTSLVFLGAASVVFAFALPSQRKWFRTISFGAAGLACLAVFGAAQLEGIPAFGAALILVSVFCGVLAVGSHFVSNLVNLFRVPNQYDIWPASRYALLGSLALVPVIPSVYWISQLVGGNHPSTAFAVGGILLASLTTNVAMLLALAKQSVNQKIESKRDRNRAPR